MKHLYIYQNILYIGVVLLCFKFLQEFVTRTLLKKKHIKSDKLQERTSHNCQSYLQPKLCPKYWFRVDPMKTCIPWLGCEMIDELQIGKKKVQGGLGKMVYSVKWYDKSTSTYIPFALVELRPDRIDWQNTIKRVHAGISNLIYLQPSLHAIQITGYCNQDNKMFLLTEYCSKFGDLYHFTKSQYFLNISPQKKLMLAINFVQAFVVLHSLSRVHCDLHDSNQAMGQFLVTNDMRVVLNDVDEMPIDDPSKNQIAFCLFESFCKMMNRSFLAPEQRYTTNECRNAKGWKASLKSDVWKIPDISGILLQPGNVSQETEIAKVKKLLQNIHDACKELEPCQRTNATSVLQTYLSVFNNLYGNCVYE